MTGRLGMYRPITEIHKSTRKGGQTNTSFVASSEEGCAMLLDTACTYYQQSHKSYTRGYRARLYVGTEM